MNSKFLLSSSLILALVVGILGGHSFWPQVNSNVGGAIAGTTNSTQRIISCVLDLSTTTPTTATTTSTGCLYNNDSSDRIITSVDYFTYGMTTTKYNGTGLAVLNFWSSTSTDQYSTTSVNVILNTTVATTVPNVYVGSTTPGQTGSAFVRVWAPSTYLNIAQNGTSTATGVVKVSYFISSQ